MRPGRSFAVSLVALSALFALVADESWADTCPYSSNDRVPFASGETSLDVSTPAPLDYQHQIRVMNVFWSDHWDAIQKHQPPVDGSKTGFLRDDINQATYRLIQSNYFDRSCQYGTGLGGQHPFTWIGDTTTAIGQPDACAANPPTDILTRADAFNLAQCLEVTPDTRVPQAGGIPTLGLSVGGVCAGCGFLLSPPCYTDLTCMQFANGTGDLLLNIFIPADAIPMTAPAPDAWHWMVPSDAYGYLAYGSQGRPIYIAVYQLEKFDLTTDDINSRLLRLMAHEMVEVLTDPTQGDFWRDPNAPDSGESEVADICNPGHVATAANYGGNGRNNLHWSSNDLTPASQIAQLAPYWSNNDHYCINVDDDPPVTSDSQAPRAGWNNGPVTVTFSSVDQPTGPSAVGTASITYAVGSGAPVTVGGATASLTVSQQGITDIAFHGTDALGHVESDEHDTVMIDLTAPALMPTGRNPSPNAFGWYGTNPPNNIPVTESFQCSDTLSGIQSCTSTVSLSTEGAGQSITGTAEDNAGNVQTLSVGPINIDLTAPVISYTGNAGTYDASSTVNISCTATDALSGVNTTNCTNIVGPAYAFGVQTSIFSSTATDKAGNVGTGSVTFTVAVTVAGMENLVRRFVANSGVAGSLIAKLERIGAAQAAGDSVGKANAVNAFLSELDGIRGKQISDGDADILAYLASFL